MDNSETQSSLGKRHGTKTNKTKQHNAEYQKDA